MTRTIPVTTAEMTVVINMNCRTGFVYLGMLMAIEVIQLYVFVWP